MKESKRSGILRQKPLRSQKPKNMKKLQYALIKDNCTSKESLTLDLKPPLNSNTNIALNFGLNIGKRVSPGAKLPSSNDMKSACNG